MATIRGRLLIGGGFYSNKYGIYIACSHQYNLEIFCTSFHVCGVEDAKIKSENCQKA